MHYPTPKPTPVVELKNIYKFHYTSTVETTALGDMSLTVAPGEFLAIMGPSGSGKSTLLNVIGMIDAPTRGSYYFQGKDVLSLSRRARSELRKLNMGFIFQSFNLIDQLTARENIELPLVYLKVPVKERNRRVDAALAELEMTHRADHYPRQLSGGQQQRIAIARAIIANPTLILADEPTGNLDSSNSKAVMEKLRYFHQKGATIIMVTHAKEDAAYAEKTIELFDGTLLIKEKDYLAS
ncbi:MAG: ABC transporter ATP-binding protein [Bacteroidota bacterium]